MSIDWMSEINKAIPVWEYGYNTYTLFDSEVFRVQALAEGNFSFPVGSGTKRLEDYQLISVYIYENQKSNFGTHEKLYQWVNPIRHDHLKSYSWAFDSMKNSKLNPQTLCLILKDIDRLNRLYVFL